MYTGFYRLLPTKDFRTELAVGYALELFLSMIPMLFCIIFNNSEAISRSGSAQEAIVEKAVAESSSRRRLRSIKSVAWETLSGENEDDTMPLTPL